MAEWAGHSVNVLLRVYAKCVYGQDEVTAAHRGGFGADDYVGGGKQTQKATLVFLNAEGGRTYRDYVAGLRHG